MASARQTTGVISLRNRAPALRRVSTVAARFVTSIANLFQPPGSCFRPSGMGWPPPAAGFGALSTSRKSPRVSIAKPGAGCITSVRRLSNLAKARRCGARTRSGHPCRQAAVTGRARCRMHGGARGSGGPQGDRNGNFKHGVWTRESADLRRAMRAQIREIRALLRTTEPEQSRARRLNVRGPHLG
jgi:hypothetical protein